MNWLYKIAINFFLEKIWSVLVSIFLKLKRKKQIDEIKEGEKQIDEANKIIDDDLKRLAEKAKGAKKIEKNISN